MDILIVGRHCKVSDQLRDKIHEKMAKIEELAPRATRVEVHVVHERNPRLQGDRERVEITVRDRSVLRAEASADDRVVALEQATAHLTDQLRKQHERKAHRHQGKVGLHAVPVAGEAPAQAEPAAESVEPWEGAPEGSTREVPIDGTPIVIRSKTHVGAPMSTSQAIDQMELVGHDFYLFVDAESGLPSAVYRRRGWTYGVIHLDAAEGEELDRETA
jgi:ribosomal subunit interface protein